MKVTGLQIDIAWEDPEANFAHCEPMIAQAAAEGARMVVLPEMFGTGFSMDSEKAASFSETTCAFLASAARQWELWILGGLVTPLGPKPGNAAVLFDPQGKEVLRYYKIHPFALANEGDHFTAGRAIRSADVEGLRVTPFICYDLRFPELFRLAADTTDLYVVIANWPSPRADAWKQLLIARAIENQCFVLGINRVGDGDGKHYRGDSALVDPEGVVCNSACEQEALVGGDIDKERIIEIRKRLPFLADRRPEQYRILEKEGADGYITDPD